MNLLILGGTQFLGRHLTEAALARGHQVTLFNRGQTNPELFTGVERLRGNRNGDLRALESRRWDGVIDTCGFVSDEVRATAKLLANAVGHYTFVSSISVYLDFSEVGLNESAPVEELPAGVREVQGEGATYGARKALCEQAVEAAMPGRVLCVRAGLMVGPHDNLGRFVYWVRRLALGGEVLAPGKPGALVQLIDARDLAGWMIRMIESGGTGVYNAAGPAVRPTFGEMLEQCLAASGSDARLSWIDDQLLLEKGVKPFSDLPFWLPMATHQGFFAVDCRHALGKGLMFRPLVDTARDTLVWDRGVGSRLSVGLDRARERELLESLGTTLRPE